MGAAPRNREAALSRARVTEARVSGRSSPVRNGVVGRRRSAEPGESLSKSSLDGCRGRVRGEVGELVGVAQQVVELFLARLVEDVLVPLAPNGAVAGDVALRWSGEVFDEEVAAP